MPDTGVLHSTTVSQEGMRQLAQCPPNVKLIRGFAELASIRLRWISDLACAVTHRLHGLSALNRVLLLLPYWERCQPDDVQIMKAPSQRPTVRPRTILIVVAPAAIFVVGLRLTFIASFRLAGDHFFPSLFIMIVGTGVAATVALAVCVLIDRPEQSGLDSIDDPPSLEL